MAEQKPLPFSFNPTSSTASAGSSSPFSLGKSSSSGFAGMTASSQPASNAPAFTSGAAPPSGLFGFSSNSPASTPSGTSPFGSASTGLFGKNATSTTQPSGATNTLKSAFNFGQPSTLNLPTNSSENAGKTSALAQPSTTTAPSPFGGSGGSSPFSFLGQNKNNSAATTTSTTPAPNKPLFSLNNFSTTPAGPPPETSTGAAPGGLFAKGPLGGGALFNIAASESQAVGPSIAPISFSPQSNTTASKPTNLFGSLTATKSSETSSPLANNQSKVSTSGNGSGPLQATPNKLSFGLTGSSTSQSTSLNIPSLKPSSAPGTSQQEQGQGGTSGGPTAPNMFASLGGTSNQTDRTTAASFQGFSITSSASTPGTSASATASAAPKPADSMGTQASTTPNTMSSVQHPIKFTPSTTATNKDGGASISGANVASSSNGSGPTAQFRLKNKSMDEIITRWATDLAKYQKEFQQQAEKVATWDQMLVENSDRISKLYSRAFRAERDTAELERQITAVENQQDELSAWLDRYEREVDEMTARQVGQDGLQGPDQERDRTYKLAEKISERLQEMGTDLKTMIEEINGISAELSKTSKPDDPLSQIVRILNGHLSQLQLIDQGAAALQAKVTAAQKENQRIAGSGFRGYGSDPADDFYRSYMGRK